MIHHSDDWLTIHQGDAAMVLATLPADSVDCIVTSPPYWGLRDYGTATWEGGDEGCDHATPRSRGDDIRPGDKQGTSAGSRPNTTLVCRCGATRQDGQLGLEATPEEYVANLVAVFRELRRVLKPSGTCWLNLGDSYAGNGRGDTYSGFNERYHGSTSTTDKQAATGQGRPVSVVLDQSVRQVPGRSTDHGDRLASKQLVGIPWRVAFALQADGWWLRSDIIWSKPNPMPESVTDRPTKAHEYLFLLTKSARYYFDSEAVREQIKASNNGTAAVVERSGGTSFGEDGRPVGALRTYDTIKGANLRSVWTIATRPYPGAHFAVFPPELPERCIKAGSSERGVCPECGAPWERVTITGVERPLTGWQPTCRFDHGTDVDAAVVLDPFAGSGTVGLVANRLSRRAILIDLNPAYLKQQMQRNAQTVVGL